MLSQNTPFKINTENNYPPEDVGGRGAPTVSICSESHFDNKQVAAEVKTSWDWDNYNAGATWTHRLVWNTEIRVSFKKKTNVKKNRNVSYMKETGRYVICIMGDMKM